MKFLRKKLSFSGALSTPAIYHSIVLSLFFLCFLVLFYIVKFSLSCFLLRQREQNLDLGAHFYFFAWKLLLVLAHCCIYLTLYRIYIIVIRLFQFSGHRNRCCFSMQFFLKSVKTALSSQLPAPISCENLSQFTNGCSL